MSIELNRIYNEDCLEGMKRIPDDSIDMVITSPPYDNLRDYNNFEWNFKETAKEIIRTLKWGGVLVWIVSDQTINGSETASSFKQALYFIDNGLKLHDTMIWSKGACRFPSKIRYYDSFEYMFVFSKGKPITVNLIADKKNKWANTIVHGTDRQKSGSTIQKSSSGKNKKVKEFGVRFNVWEVANVGKRGNPHPATFPLQLIVDHIESWSQHSDTILDPFMGSGTTAIACMNTGRKFIGFETDATYYQQSLDRIEQHEQQLLELKEEKV